MLKIALTGNIAAGKSQVEKIISELGIKIIDADKIVENLYKDNNFINIINSEFSEYDLFENNLISKEKIAKIIFKDKIFKTNFEKTVHKFVFEEIKKFFDTNKNENVIIVSVPLLFECGWQKYFDKIILITADVDIRCNRLMKRNNLTFKNAKIRIEAQMLQEEKINKADFVIDNNGSIESLKENILSLLRQLNG